MRIYICVYKYAYAYINSRKYNTDPPHHHPYHPLCKMQSTGIWCGSNGKHPLPPISHQLHNIIKIEDLPLSHFALHMRQGRDISLRQILSAYLSQFKKT